MDMVILFLSALFLLIAVWLPREPTKCNFIGALIGAGASLIGGALNRKAQKKANAANSPVGQVAQYEAAGLNPVPFMLGGGYIPQQATSIGDSFATAGGIFAEHIATKKERNLRETQIELENERLKKELDKLARPSEPGYMQSYGGTIPLPSLGGSNERRDLQTLSGPVVGSSSYGSGPLEIGRETVTHAGDLGTETYVNPRVKDAETTEARYGDVVQQVSGFYNLAADNWYNDRLQGIAARYGRQVADNVHREYSLGDARSLSDVVEQVTEGEPTRRRPRSRPFKDMSEAVVIPQFGTPQYAEYLKGLMQ